MPATARVLGQAYLGTGMFDLYTVPAGASAVVSSVTLCNTTGSAATMRLRVAPAGAADTAAHAVYHDVPIPAADTFVATLGITLGAGDVLRASGSVAGIAASVFGQEITA